MKLKLISTLIIGSLLSGCGSDSKDTPPPPLPEVPDRSVGWDYIETPYMEFSDEGLKGVVFSAFGKVDDKALKWVYGYSDRPDAGTDTNGDGAVNLHDLPVDVFNTLVDGSPVTPYDSVDVAEMRRVLASNPDGLGAGTSRPDVFIDGNYSVFDLLRYFAATRDDMQFDEGSIIHYSDSKFGTFEFSFSWDYNGDGDFTNDGIYSNSANWHFTNNQSGGKYDVWPSRSTGAYNYERMDTYWLRPSAEIRFMPFSDTMTKRRQWVYQQEVKRFEESDGEFVIPYVQYQNLATGQVEVFAENLKVKAFDIRSDVFQKGQITIMDVWLTLAHEHGMDFRLSYWPTMSSGAKVNSFALSTDPITGTYGGYVAGAPLWGELAHQGDFDQHPQCNFGLDGTPDGEGRLTEQECISEWLLFSNGQNELAGSLLLPYPKQMISQVGPMDTTYMKVVDEIDLLASPGKTTNVYITDHNLQSADIIQGYDQGDKEAAVLRRQYAAEEPVGNAPILDENHFGWKIADCNQCHNEEKNPLGHGGHSWPTNYADGFDFTQPHYCATCHGNNGATDNHNRGTRCYWCHNNEGDMTVHNHGDIGTNWIIPEDELLVGKRKFTYNPSGVGIDGRPIEHKDISHNINSDYNFSRTFPAPYSCLTCHK